MRKTKIVCTLGPACRSEEVLRQMMLAGMDVARINFSHGTYEEHSAALATLFKLREELRRPVAALLDTKGPEIRLGNFKNHKELLEPGQSFVLTGQPVEGDSQRVSISYPGLCHDVKAGDSILLDDGLIELRVEEILGGEIHCRVLNGGAISDHKGVNVPNVSLSLPYISEQDRKDLCFGIQAGFDFVAASFVRTAQDVQSLRELLKENGGQHIRIISKIENAEGVRNIDEIIRVSDGIMVARGDMGVEIPFEKVPRIQKELIHKVYQSGKIVITATQMLESMVKNPRPTRAEATDVANAIYDGTSAIMLSGETAAGAYPVEAVRTMDKIARETEQDINYRGRFLQFQEPAARNVTNAISHATCMTAYDLEASAILTVTESGQTARMISKYRPDIPIIGCTINETVYRQLAMSWGVTPILCQLKEDTDSLFNHAVQRAKEEQLISDGDLVVITAGVPLGIPGTTNLLKVHIVGDVILSGKGVGQGRVRANVCVARSESDARQNFRAGDILVMEQTSNSMMDLLRKAGGLIVSDGDENGHAAIVGLSLEIPVLVGAQNCVKVLRSGTTIILDAEKGIICNIAG